MEGRESKHGYKADLVYLDSGDAQKNVSPYLEKWRLIIWKAAGCEIICLANIV